MLDTPPILHYRNRSMREKLGHAYDRIWRALDYWIGGGCAIIGGLALIIMWLVFLAQMLGNSTR